MIIRTSTIRHGQRVLAGAASRSCLRAFATQPTTTTSTVAEPSSEEIPAALTAALSYAKKRADDAALKAEIAKVPGNYKQFRHIGRHTSNIGSRVASRYDPNDVLNNPPDDVTLEMLMAAQAHMGHNTSLWNPANSRYIYGIRDGIHIISLETTAAYLRRAARVVEEVAYRGGLILFAGTRKGQKQIVVRAAQLVSGCHVFQKWMPGAITNRDQILEGRQLRMLNKLDCEADGYEDHMLDRRPVMPDLVVCLNPTENYTLLYECGLENIPTIGIMDTDADPTWVTYQIPANDDSIRCVTLIAAMLGRAGQRGQERRLAYAAEGRSTWEPPQDVRLYIQRVEAAMELKMSAETENYTDLEELSQEALKAMFAPSDKE